MSVNFISKGEDPQVNNISKLNQNFDKVIQRIQSKENLFRIVKDKNLEESVINPVKNESVEKIKDDIQKQAIQIVFKGPNSVLKPQEHGQAELRCVFQLLEKELKHVEQNSNKQPQEYAIQQLQKKQGRFNQATIKPFQEEGEDQAKKKRVDKNKCRVCGESTIPVILDLINEDNNFSVSSNTNLDLTMRQIRENLMSKRIDAAQTDANKQNAVPYIPLNYSQKIVICKRCRFKFHSKCLEDKKIEIPKQSDSWICQFCDDKIRELQSLNLWDYENNKKKKKDDVTTVQPILASDRKEIKEKDQGDIIKKRIGECKIVFKVENFGQRIKRQLEKAFELTEEQKKQNFFKDFPLYKNENGDVAYPVFDSKDKLKQYGPIIEFKQKPKYTQLDNVSKFLSVSTVMNLISKRLGQQGLQDSPKSVFFPYLQILLSLFYEEVMAERRFEFYQRVLDANSGSFFSLLRFIHLSQKVEETYEQLFIFIWGEFCKQIERIIDTSEILEVTPIIQKVQNLQKINDQEMSELLFYIQSGVYNLESFCQIVGERENLNIDNQKELQNNMGFYQENSKAFINQSLFLGEDQEDRKYLWYPFYPQYIFVDNHDDWGYYKGEEILDLLGSLELKGVRENNLAQNIDQLLENKMICQRSSNTLKPKLVNQEDFQLNIEQIKTKLSECDQTISDFLKQKYSRWANKATREKFREDLKNCNDFPQLLQLLKQFVDRLQQIEKIELHPKIKQGQENQDIAGNSNEAMDEESNSSSSESVQQQVSIAQQTSSSPPHKDFRKTRLHSNLPKPQPQITQFVSIKKKEKLPLPPFEELENNIHGVRRTQTKIFTFHAHLKVPFLHYLTNLDLNNAEGLYFSIYVLQKILQGYVEGKERMRRESKEKGKRGRKPREEMIELEKQLQMQQLQEEMQLEQRKNMFQVVLERFEQIDEQSTKELTPKEKEPQIQRIENPLPKYRIDSLASRREKRGNAGKNPKIHELMELPVGHKKYCTKCVRPMDVENKCPSCQKIFHSECMGGLQCQNCRGEKSVMIHQPIPQRPRRRNNANVLFYDD